VSASLGRAWAIAVNSFREAIRSKVLYGIAVMAAVLTVVGAAIGSMSLHEEARVARDVSVAGISFFGMVTAVYLGVSMLYAEIQKKTIHTILAKPIERHEFVLGKYLGMVITLTIMALLFLVGLVLQLYAHDTPLTTPVVMAMLLGYAEVLVVAAIAVFFSSFSSPFLSGIFTVLLWLLGRWTDEISDAAAHSTIPAFRVIAGAGMRVIPDLHLFSISGSELDGRHVSVHGTFVSWGYVGHAAAYAATWILVLLVLASLIFRKRDFL
jgi:ABC-type transport system involved in multi-copper enzyme maturation permease subunit